MSTDRGRRAGMPRTAGASVGDSCYHVISRGNAQIVVFRTDGDYQAFIELIRLACQRIPMRVLTYCAMPKPLHWIR
jgi:REP element-mobilizing transposase RayT